MLVWTDWFAQRFFCLLPKTYRERSFFPRPVQTDSKCTIPADKKWTSLFLSCRQSLGCLGDRDAEHGVVWKAILDCLISGRDTKLSRNDQEVTKELLSINSDMEHTAKECTNLPTIQRYLSKVSLRTILLVSAVFSGLTFLSFFWEKTGCGCVVDEPFQPSSN